jgi:hypothetical protein
LVKKITGCLCDDQSTACDRFALDGREMNLKRMHRISKQHSLEIHRSSVTNFPFVLSSTLCWARLNFKLFFLFFLRKQGLSTLLQNSKILAWGILEETLINFKRDPGHQFITFPSFIWLTVVWWPIQLQVPILSWYRSPRKVRPETDVVETTEQRIPVIHASETVITHIAPGLRGFY